MDERLELKKGAQVMFIKNDYSGDQRYFNGKIGHVRKLGGMLRYLLQFNRNQLLNLKQA